MKKFQKNIVIMLLEIWLLLYDYYFCIPFYYYVKEVFDDDNITVKDTYLTINPLPKYCQDNYSNEKLSKINKLSEKNYIN